MNRSSDTAALSHYRPDIDGLRAIAVLLVLGFHAFPNRVPGGFVGVDVFFVISGYLISGIILQALKHNRFGFGSFYARRVRRILPALVVVLAFSYAVGWWVLLPDEYSLLSKHVASAAGFFSNFTFWSEAGYFDFLADTKPLQHLWSLAIEEQFYILWPLVLVISWRQRWNIPVVILLIGGASFIWNVVTITQSYVAAFYSPGCRIWELMIGALYAALTIEKRTPPLVGVAADIVSLFGLALICAAVVLIDKSSAFPGWWAVLPTAGALSVIVAESSRINRIVLGWWPLVWIGLISYPLYLWHWPLLVYAKLVFGHAELTFGPLGSVAKMIVLALSFCAAVLTYWRVELPVRRHFSFRLAGGLAGCLLAIFVVSSVIFANGGLPRMRDNSVTKLLSIDWTYPTGPERRIEAGNLDRVFVIKSNRVTTTLFIGDSNIEQYFPRALKLIEERPDDSSTAIFIGNQGKNCWHVIRIFTGDENYCDGAMKEMKRLALATTNEAVVLTMAGASYQAVMNSTTGPDTLGAFIKSLTGNGKTFYLVLGIPEGHELNSRSMFQGSRLTKLEPKPVDQVKFDADAFFARYADVRERLKKLAADTGAIAVDPVEFLCRDGTCPVFDEHGTPNYQNGFHLRATYARSAASYIDQTLRPSGRNNR